MTTQTQTHNIMSYGEFKGTPVSEVPDRYLEWLLQSSHDNFYTLRQEMERREAKQPLPAKPFILAWGAYKGKPVTEPPDTYLGYLINEAYKSYHLAKDELTLRVKYPALAVSSEVKKEL